MVLCAVIKCNNRSGRTSNVGYFAFPRIISNKGVRIQETSTKRRIEWMSRIHRADLNDSNVDKKKVCSDHFIQGKPADLMDINSPDWAPSVNLGHDKYKSNALASSKRYKREKMENPKKPMQNPKKPMENPKKPVENLKKSQVPFGKHLITARREKRCNKCGFVTFSLRVLYSHKYRCTGQLLGKPSVCSYCKRKFHFITLYRSHIKTCVEKRLKKATKKNKEKNKQSEKQEEISSSKYSFSCPICHASFNSKTKFVDHLKQPNCTAQPTVKKSSFSARKSISHNKSSKLPSNHKKILSAFKLHDDVYRSEEAQQHRCLWCKSEYPTEKLLFMHFQMNENCAVAYYQKVRSDLTKKVSSKARKTLNVVARKSFPHRKQPEAYNYPISSVSKKARKSLPSSSVKKKAYNESRRNVSRDALNQCPVCYKDFPDTFTFYQHQKMMNHWGKATKSISSSCKCPFCEKEFLHITSRNVHVLNHSDRSDREIKNFLRNCSCGICSVSFVSELAKMQHMKIEHPGQVKFSASGSNTSDNESTNKQKMSSVPTSVKKKLRQQPNTCPICSKAFSHTVLRNKHFNEVHLKIFECQFCNTKFKSTSSLTNHIQQIHGKNLNCKGCKASFSNELELLQHIIKYHPNQDTKSLLPSKPVKNTSSKEKFGDGTDEIKMRHTERASSSGGSNVEFYCDVCNIGYKKLCGLTSHRMSKLHKETLEKSLDAVQKSLSDVPSSSPSAAPRVVKQPEILTCSECSEEFTNIKDFVPHRLSHFSYQSRYLKINELNPYMCEICSDVLDSHSQVQLHLFWHLQVESTSNKNNSLAQNKTETIVPDRLSGQHVAKKSFSKPTNETQQVVIGGVAKTLFTCEACNISFTTKVHYNMHVRKLCKKLKTFQPISKYSSSRSEMNDSLEASETGIAYCQNCNFMFASDKKLEQHKEYCMEYHFDDSEDLLVNSEAVKSALNLNSAVAGCVTCAALFEDISSIENHLIFHQTDSFPAEAADVLLCAVCNCLFSLSAFRDHRDFCKIPVNTGEKVNSSKHFAVLKSALELRCAQAACVCCGLPFDDLEPFAKHLILHQTNLVQTSSVDKNVCNGETSASGINFESENSLNDNSLDFSLGNIKSVIPPVDEEHSELHHKSIDFNSDNASDTLIESKTSVANSKQNDKSSNSLQELRENFSNLLCCLIKDTQLLKELGFGKEKADDVLVNVLQHMGQKPFTGSGSNIELFRKNIQMFLELCLNKDFLETVVKDKTVDEMVVEALRMFECEEMSDDSD